MKIILVITDSGGKNLVFVMDNLRAYSIDEAIKLVAKNEIRGAYSVRTGAGSYLRSPANAIKVDNIDSISVSSHMLFTAMDNLSLVLPSPGFKIFWTLSQAYLRGREQNG